MSAGVDEKRSDGVAAGVLGHVGGVGDEEAVLRGGGELGNDPDVVESHGGQLMGEGVWQAQVDGVAGDELEVFDRFGADQKRIGLSSQLLQQVLGGAAVKVVVLQRSDAGDAGRVDTVEVLEVGADVGEAMLDWFDRPDTG